MAPMPLADALRILGITPGTSMVEVRSTYRRRVRGTHPDLVDAIGADGGTAHTQTALLTAAFAAVRSAVQAAPDGRVPDPSAGDADLRAAGPAAGACAPRYADSVEAEPVDSDTIAIAAPATEAFALLLDAATSIGSVGYVDRQLGILEIMVRFEGGPTCSVLVTLQGRAHGTDAFCTMDSIEATPTPPVRPVVEALVAALIDPS